MLFLCTLCTIYQFCFQVVQNFKIAGKKQIIAIKSQSPKVVQASQGIPFTHNLFYFFVQLNFILCFLNMVIFLGNVTTKKVVISSNSNQKVLLKTTAPTSTPHVSSFTKRWYSIFLTKIY